MFLLFLLVSSVLLTAEGDVEIVPITHGSVVLKWQGKTIYVDPWGRGNYQGVSQADLILITDIHGDHMDPAQIAKVRKADTVIVAPAAVQKTVTEATVLNNGRSTAILGIKIEAVPMYNLKRGPGPGQLYHTKGRGNGYVLTLGTQRFYFSGDTECIPEMRQLGKIDVAFVCMNLPYTMTPEEAAECVNAFKPRVVYPYHYRGSDLNAFKKAVNALGVEVRILDWY
ncbi:MBL fold metallo-hydrolase [Acidobacteria bacterium AH-259-A15]|nr:MBL fold metallo-hydrolase [Acidobacteria bacterium AH-259-A15]